MESRVCGRLARLLGPFILACLCNNAVAEQSEESIEELGEQTEAAAKALDDRKFLVMPIPISNPSIGTGLGLTSMYLFQAGENAPASSITAGGFWADSESWAGFIGGKVHFRDDIYRLSGGAGYFDVNVKFYGIGNGAGDRGRYITINQSGPLFVPRLVRRVADKLYVGAQYRRLSITTTAKDLPDWLPGDVLQRDLDVSSAGLGLVLEYDTRDSNFNPHDGSFLDMSGNFAMESIGSDRDYRQYNAAYSLYHQLGEGKVLAWRATGCFIGGDAPFWDLCSFGGREDAIRGYVSGQYRDELSLTTQLEYRWKFSRKWGMVAFGGIGKVAQDLGDLDSGDLLPSYGAGIRYMVAEKQRINLGIDYAYGKDSGAWYFRISEAF